MGFYDSFGRQFRGSPRASPDLHEVRFEKTIVGAVIAKCGTCPWRSPFRMRLEVAYDRAVLHLRIEARRSGLAVPQDDLLPRDDLVELAGHLPTGDAVSLLEIPEPAPTLEPEPAVEEAPLSPWEREQRTLDGFYDALEAMVERAAQLTDDVGVDARTSRRAAEMRAERRQQHQRVIEDPNLPLAIGRIDRPGAHYVGRFSVFDDRSTAVVSSWRAPASSAFYSATREQPREVHRRRRVVERGRQITQIADEVLIEPLPEELQDDLIDDVEAEALLLEALEGARTGRMGDIIATIVPEQFALIARPATETLLVQGAPGSGKSAIGLHRASYLLYPEGRLELSPEDVLVVGPNPTFLDYISDVLPALGEEEVRQLTVAALTGHSRAPRESDPRVATVKGRPAMAQVLRNAVWGHVTWPTGARTIDKVSMSAERLSELMDSAMATRGGYIQRRDEFVDRLIRELRGRKDEEPNRRNVTGAVERLWPSLYAERLVLELLADKEQLRAAAHGLLLDHDVELLVRADGAPLTASDAVLVDEVRAVLGEREGGRYAHVIVDEVQDLTPMQLRMIARRSRSRCFTVLGDVAQSTAPGAVTSWSEILSVLDPSGPVNYTEIRTAYRTPAESLEFAARLFDHLDVTVDPPVPYRDGFLEPVIRPVTDTAHLHATLRQELEDLVDEEISVGVIVPAGRLDEIYESLEQAGVEVDMADSTLTSKVTVVTADLAHGIEFDHTVIVEPAEIVGDDGERGLRRLYVSLTRTTHTMTVLHSAPLPWALREYGTDADDGPMAPPSRPGSRTGGRSSDAPTPMRGGRTKSRWRFWKSWSWWKRD